MLVTVKISKSGQPPARGEHVPIGLVRLSLCCGYAGGLLVCFEAICSCLVRPAFFVSTECSSFKTDLIQSYATRLCRAVGQAVS